MDYLSTQFLQQITLFSNIKSDSLEQLIQIGHVHCYPAGQSIFYDKDPLSCVYIVLSGTASLYKTHESGQTKMIFILGKGDLLNEIIVGDLPSSVNCRAYSNCTVLCLYKEDLLPIMEKDFVLMQNFMSALSNRVRRLYRQLKNSTSVIKMEKKLAAKLWRLGRDYGVPCTSGTLIDFSITVTSLADLLGSYRETVSRALKILIEKELIIYQDKRITIPNMDSLSKFFKAP